MDDLPPSYTNLSCSFSNDSFPAMAEKKMDDLPPSYTNLNYDSDPVAGPSAPRFPETPRYEGYGTITPPKNLPPKYNEEPTFDGNFRGHAANPSAPPSDPEAGAGILTYTPPNLVFENIYEACVEYADQNCCYGKRFLNQMKLMDVINKVVFYYKLESFTEKREIEAKCAPYKGEQVNGPENGVAQEPWSITVLPPQLFNDCHVTTKIQHTDVVYTCSRCRGLGDLTCEECRGRGSLACPWCRGSGRDSFRSSCAKCTGDGWKMCWTCLGSGKYTCTGCRGYAKTKHWKALNVTWKNHVEEYFTDAGNLPVDLIREAQGVELLKKKDLSLQPITNAPDATINAASARMFESHPTSFRNERIIRQRHELRAVPLTRVTYQWKEQNGEFYVYDTDRKVHFDFYPQPYCCCTCS